MLFNTITDQPQPIQIQHSASTDPEIIIIGAGPAGCSLAYSLSHTGRRILLLERDLSTPDRIVGELLQPGGVAALEKLGMLDCLEGIDAVGVEGYCVVMGERRVGIPYPDVQPVVESTSTTELGEKTIENEKSLSPMTGPSGRTEGRSFHHGPFISSLRSKVMNQAPNVQVVQGTAKSLITCDLSRRVIGVNVWVKNQNKDEKDGLGAGGEGEIKNYFAPLTIIADGCFSKFRSVASTSSKPVITSSSTKKSLMKTSKPTATIKTRSHFVGAVLKDLSLPLPRHGTVCLTPLGPVLFYQIADKANETRMLVDVKGKLPSVSDGSLKKLIMEGYMPHLPEMVKESMMNALERDEQRLRVMPNSFLPPKIQGRRGGREGVVMVGDSWNMRHPLTGGGCAGRKRVLFDLAF